MKKINILCLATLLFGFSINANTNNNIEVYDNLYELNSNKSSKRANEVDETKATLNVSDVKVQTTVLEENQTRDIRFVAAIDSLDYLEVGFEITAKKSETEYKTITKVVEIAYTGIEVNGKIQKTEEVFGSTYKYMIAYEISDIPAYSYGYTYSATAYVKTELETAKSTNDKEVTISAISFDDMITSASNKFELTSINDYNGNWLSIGWAESSTSILNTDIDFKKDVYFRLTLIDGNVLYYDKGNETCHQNGATSKIFGINCQFEGLNTKEGFKKVEIILNNNGELNYGYKEFFNLDNVTNLAVSEDYIITFDTLENAASYTIKIYNDSYTGEGTSIKSGDKLSIATLAEGTYNIELTAIGNFGYTNSVTTLENAFTIESAQEILTAPVGAYEFDFDRIGRGNNYETPIKITWTDEKYAAYDDGSISEFGFYVGGVKKSGLSSANGFDNKYYDSYYGIYYSSGEPYDTTAKTVYSIRFYITTETGQVYYVHHKFFIGLVDGTTNNDRNFIQQGTEEYNTIIDEHIDNGDSLTTYNEFIATSNSEVQAASNAIDGNEGSRWESAHIDDVELVIDLNGYFNITQLSLIWEGAYGKAYTIEVSENGTDYTVVQTITDNNKVGEYLNYTFEANNVRYIKLDFTERGTGWGYSIFEINIYGAEVTA